jgi:hypothetical protein
MLKVTTAVIISAGRMSSSMRRERKKESGELEVHVVLVSALQTKYINVQHQQPLDRYRLVFDSATGLAGLATKLPVFNRIAG